MDIIMLFIGSVCLGLAIALTLGVLMKILDIDGSKLVTLGALWAVGIFATVLSIIGTLQTISF